MALRGNCYIQNTDPGAVGYGYDWKPDDGNWYTRDTTNTTWNLVGNCDVASLGNMPKTGGNATGAITGVSGWAPVNSPDFQTSAKLDGIDLATSNDLATLRSDILSIIDARVASALAGQSTSLSVGSNVTFDSGVSGDLDNSGTFTIPLPQYEDGSTATTDEVSGRYGAWPVRWYQHDSAIDAANFHVHVLETSPGSRTFQIECDHSQVVSGFRIGYVIMGIRS